MAVIVTPSCCSEKYCPTGEFMAGVRKGLDAIKRGEVVSLDEAEKKIEQWTTR